MKRDPAAPMQALEQPRPGRPPRPIVPRPERWRLSNGLRVVAASAGALPQVALRLVLPAGSAADPADRPGLGAMVGGLLSEGTASLSAEELNRRLDLLGASLSAQVGHDFTEVDLFLLSETLPEGLELLAELVTRPAFPEGEIERVRAETLDALDARADEPANVADDHLAAELFGAEHPYGRLSMGTPEGVASISRDDLVDYHARHYRPDGAVLVIAGAFETGAVASLLDRVFSDWTGHVAPALDAGRTAEPPRAGDHLLVGWPDAAQGEIRFGGLGMPRTHPEWIAGAVANYLLGGSTITGRLGANLREEKGWTYGIRSGFTAAVQPGGWVIETAVDAEVVDAAVREIRAELDRFTTDLVSEEELARARDALVLSLPRAFETPGRMVGRLATVEAFGLPDDYWDRFPDRVEAVTREEVLRIARAYFDPARLLSVVVGPGADAG